MRAGKITALRVQERDSQRINVFVDGEFALGVSLATLTRERLFVGQQLSHEDFTRLEQTESVDKALHAALRFIESRPRSQAEIRDRLQRKGYSPETVSAALERMQELGLADDAMFARYWVENRQAHRPRGASALRSELRQKGIAPALIAEMLEDSELLGDEGVRAIELGRSVMHKYAGSPDYATFTRRLGGYLQRRGFGFDSVRPALEQLWGELQRRK